MWHVLHTMSFNYPVNPTAEDKKHYRTYVIYVVPTINQLDFSPITKQDRENAVTWSQFFRRKLSGEADEDDF